MAGPAPPVPTLCPDSSLAAGQATAIAPHPLPRPWSSPAVVMLTVKLASGVRFSVGEYGKLIFSISFHHRHPAISISSGRRCLRCAFLLRPSHSSAPRPLRSANPGKPAASLPTESLYRCLSPSWPRSSRPFLQAPPAKEINGRRRESISLLLGVPRSSSAAPRQQVYRSLIP